MCLFSYLEIVFIITPNDIWTPIFHSYEVWLWNFLALCIQHFISFTSTVYTSNWRKFSCLQTLRRFYGVISLLRYFLVGIILFENQDDLCFLWGLGLWLLTTQSFQSYILAYFRSIYLIFIEFQNIDNNLGNPPKKLFLPL